MYEWRPIPDFYGYLVNEEGEIKNELSRTLLTYHFNQQGIPSVVLHVANRQYRRSVALIVARAFLPYPPHPHFNSIIHIDGDRANCHAENLAWRPRWFAVKYHQQMREDPYPEWSIIFEIVETGEQFKHPREFALKYGVLEEDVEKSLLYVSPVFPIGLHCAFVNREGDIKVIL